MNFEREGFPGKMVLAGGQQGGYVPYPKPHVSHSGWISSISPIAGVTDRLPYAIQSAATNTTLLQGSVLEGLRARITTLDGLLSDTYEDAGSGERWTSIRNRIDNLW